MIPSLFVLSALQSVSIQGEDMAVGEFPFFNFDVFDTYTWGDTFGAGDQYRLVGNVAENGGHLLALSGTTGTSPDHEISVGPADCNTDMCFFNLQILKDDNITSGRAFLPHDRNGMAVLSYTELKASLQTHVVEEFPFFQSTRYVVYARPDSNFTSFDEFRLEGCVTMSGGHVLAKPLNRTSPEHEVIFGPVDCTRRSNPNQPCSSNLTIMVHGDESNLTTGQGLLPTNFSEYAVLDYTDLKANLENHFGVVLSDGNPESQKAVEQFPFFNYSLFEIYNWGTGTTFWNGNKYRLSGNVDENGGHVLATLVSGAKRSPDHEIYFGPADCKTHLCSFNLTVVVGENRSTGQALLPRNSNGTAVLSYTTLKASLQTKKIEEFPFFRSTHYEVYNHPDGHKFVTGDFFWIEGVVTKDGGAVLAKQLNGTSPEHQVVFGPADCTTHLCSFNLTILLHGDEPGLTTGWSLLPTNFSEIAVLSYKDLKANLESRTDVRAGVAMV